jgi:alpha-L-fucosidase
LIRSLQPKAILNNRGFDEGDYGTPERDFDASLNTATVFERPTEACESVGYQSWGYRRDEDYFLPEVLIRSMHKALAKGGNYLLNVGPDADGEFPQEALDLLASVGRWYRTVKESLIGVAPGARLSAAPGLVSTTKGDAVYIHILTPPVTGSVFLHPHQALPREAVLLNTGQRLHCDVTPLPRLFHQQPKQCLRLRGFPSGVANAAGWVVRLEGLPA